MFSEISMGAIQSIVQPQIEQLLAYRRCVVDHFLCDGEEQAQRMLNLLIEIH